MKFCIREDAVASLSLTAVAARILYGVTIDLPWLYNSGWISVLLGGALAMPVAFAVGRMRAASGGKAPLAALAERRPPLARALAVLLAATAAVDAAEAVEAIAVSAGYAALDSVAMAYLLLPQLALCAWGLTLNGDAIGGSAGVLNRILLCVLALFTLREAPDLCPAWLTPVLGPGAPALIEGALRAAGWLSLPLGLFLIAEPDSRQPANAARPEAALAACCAVGTVLVLVHGMMLPALVRTQNLSRDFLLDTVLTNGRTALSLQLPKMIVWFVGLFLRMLFDGFVCAAMLQAALPKLPRWALIALVTLGVAALALSGALTSAVSAAFGRWLYAAQAGAALAALAAMGVGKGAAQCAGAR